MTQLDNLYANLGGICIIIYKKYYPRYMSPYIHYDERDKNTNSQTNSSTKHILNTHGDDVK